MGCQSIPENLKILVSRYLNLNHLNLQYIKSGNYSLLFVYIFQKVDFRNCVIGGFIE